MTALIQDANSMDRYWRKLTRENPELRGIDYETKKIVVQRKQKDLGYESGYFELSNNPYEYHNDDNNWKD